MLYASFCLTNLGQFTRADSVVRLVDRNALSEYHRAWLDYRIGLLAGNYESGLQAIRIAARLAPGSKAVYNHAAQALQSGHVREALAALQTLPPDRGPMRGFLGYWILLAELHHVFGSYEREYDVGSEGRRRYPERLAALIPVVRARAAQGRLEALERELRTAERLPADPFPWNFGDLLQEAGEELRAHGHPTEARRFFQRSSDWYGKANRGPGTGWKLAVLAYSLDRWQEAAGLADSLRQSEPDNVDYQGLLGLSYARMGLRSRALAITDSLARDQRHYQFGGPSLYRARIAAVLGDRDAAVAKLRDAFAEGREYDLWLHRDRDFETLRDYPPFAQLVKPKD